MLRLTQELYFQRRRNVLVILLLRTGHMLLCFSFGLLSLTNQEFIVAQELGIDYSAHSGLTQAPISPALNSVLTFPYQNKFEKLKNCLVGP